MRTRKIVSAALLVAALAVGTAACGSMNADKDKMEQTSTPVSYTHLTLPTTPYV